ncbi:pyridoxal-phosphate dependent enzyme [Paraliomyxa miuraensis]|uniref:pyridoxal-phosphate dependent enzyme n=1 Tax=Paraliomyxa miuraensis TaxID=376150 RepID=UPI002252FC1C|nr:pyridoxal-phosphate dependent enzyme [Paraliomyxa miuraensis]
MPRSWRDLIDERHGADQSLLLRYWKALEVVGLRPAPSLESLQAVSRGEGARVLPLPPYCDVELSVSDETSLMSSGTYKALDACLTVAMVERQGTGRVVTSSGGNLGHALARYCHARGIETFCFQPRSTGYKLDASTLAFPGVHVASADLPEPEIKALARGFAERFGLLHVPALPWRLAASAARAMFLLEAVQSGPAPVEWIAQAMCAGYGPVGIYDCFAALVDGGLLAAERVPKLLGIQQQANAPMVRAWSEGSREIGQRHRRPRPAAYLEPGLYNTDPGANYTRLHAHLERFGGALVGVDGRDYERHAERVVQWLADAGVVLTRRPESDEVLEKAGLLAAVGLLEAIERGHVAPGARALSLLTGGVRASVPSVPAARPRPPIEVDGSLGLDAWVEELGRRWSLPSP